MRPSSTGMAPVDSRPPAAGEITSAQSGVYGGIYQSRATRLMARVHEALLTPACGRFCCKSRLLPMDRLAISLRTTGFDQPALTLSTQLLRYAMRKAAAGGGRATSEASRRRF